ncbi:MAG: hypothetical protein HGB22_03995 [Chlorobiaceae bacterium]|nr:hypothetical protein [Chlorobiaceae bacterium]
MKKSVKGILASIGVSTLIAGGSLPLMAADSPETPQVKEGKAGKKCAGMKKAEPTANVKASKKGTAVVKDNVTGKKCAGMTPAAKAKAGAETAK